MTPRKPANPNANPNSNPNGAPTSGMVNVTQHWFDNDMDQWGKTRGDEVFEGANRVSRLLGPDGAPLVYPKPRLGFDLTPRARR